ncbi:hypothetical protein VTN77DRAFT_1970 [Rasamsonia byssochlamydoides]|uniref:uncharacterized protein n=1 Tax=Rasamsonia byssochlamydoides TaxID=89139 RepID=UPI003742B81A
MENNSNHPVHQSPRDTPNPPGATPSENATPNRPKRRRRVPIACANCRLRKTKCDHIVPRNVTDKSLSGLTPSAQDYIRSLEYKLKQYEEKIRDQNDEIHQRALPSESTGVSPASQRQAFPASVSQPHQPPQRKKASVIATSPEIFLGGDSGVSFTQLILNAMNPGGCDRLQAQSFSSPRDLPRETGDPDIYALPHDVRDLIQLYFDFHYALSPIFHVPTIFAKFDEVFNCDPSRRHEHTYTLAIINMICAIAAAHRRFGAETTISQTRKLYDRAMALVGPTILYDWTIEKVQILLLGARYLQSSNYPDECWTVLGLAIRIAHGLELHRPPPDGLDCVTKEVRKRVWYACYITDQLLSTIYGRPGAISSTAFTTPLPEDLDDDCIQPNRLLYPSVRTPSVVSFSLQVARLYKIMEAATSLVDPPLEKILQLDEEFEAWYAQVPPSFRIYDQETIKDGKALILALRANMVRILIHRHSLVSTLNSLSQGKRASRFSDSLRTNMMQSSRHICVRTAEETVQLVSHRHEQTKKAVGPSWFNLYYLFNAILIIASHVVDPEYRDDKEALSHLEQAMYMIRQMSANHACAQRAYVFLRQLLDLVDKTLPANSRKTSGPTEADSHGSSVSAGESVPTEVGYDAQASRDFFAFWDNTEDLTAALGSQLESYTALGSGLWSWGYGPSTDARMYTATPAGSSIVP